MFVIRTSAVIVGSLLGLVGVARAQEPVRVDSLQVILARLSARIDSLEAGRCPGGETILLPALMGVPAMDSVLAALSRLASRTERLAAARCGVLGAGARVVAADTARDELAELRAAAAAAGAAGTPDTVTPVKPEDVQFVGRQRGLNALNPEISATGDLRFIGRRKESPPRNNAVAREFEFAFQSDLDPYSHTKVFLTFEDEEVGVEEGYIYYTGLPGQIRVDAGKFRQQLGELNRVHQHALPETEYPLVYRRFLGEEGLTGVGLSLYTALPVGLAGGTHEVYVQGTSAESEPLFGASHQLSILGHINNFWQVSRSSYFQVGMTGAAGNNSDAKLQSRLLGADFRFTYRPPNKGTRQDLTIRAEGYRLRAHEDGFKSTRYGTFVEGQFKTSRRLVLGLRYDYAESPRGVFDSEWAVVPAVTWWQSEFVYLRLEGQRHRMTGQNLDQMTFQVVWAMGPHKHENY